MVLSSIPVVGLVFDMALMIFHLAFLHDLAKEWNYVRTLQRFLPIERALWSARMTILKYLLKKTESHWLAGVLILTAEFDRPHDSRPVEWKGFIDKYPIAFDRASYRLLVKHIAAPRPDIIIDMPPNLVPVITRSIARWLPNGPRVELLIPLAQKLGPKKGMPIMLVLSERGDARVVGLAMSIFQAAWNVPHTDPMRCYELMDAVSIGIENSTADSEFSRQLLVPLLDLIIQRRAYQDHSILPKYFDPLLRACPEKLEAYFRSLPIESEIDSVTTMLMAAAMDRIPISKEFLEECRKVETLQRGWYDIGKLKLALLGVLQLAHGEEHREEIEAFLVPESTRRFEWAIMLIEEIDGIVHAEECLCNKAVHFERVPHPVTVLESVWWLHGVEEESLSWLFEHRCLGEWPELISIVDEIGAHRLHDAMIQWTASSFPDGIPTGLSKEQYDSLYYRLPYPNRRDKELESIMNSEAPMVKLLILKYRIAHNTEIREWLSSLPSQDWANPGQCSTRPRSAGMDAWSTPWILLVRRNQLGSFVVLIAGRRMSKCLARPAPTPIQSPSNI